MSEVEQLRKEIEKKRQEQEDLLAQLEKASVVKTDADRVQELLFENKKLTNQNAKLQDKVVDLSRRLRNATRTEEIMGRRERLFFQYLSAIQGALYKADQSGLASNPALTPDQFYAVGELRMFSMPQARLDVVDFVVQLRKWSTDDEAFSALLDKMGFEEYESVAEELPMIEDEAAE